MNRRIETLNVAQPDFRLLIEALDELLVWFGPAFNLAGFAAGEAREVVYRLVFLLPDYQSAAAAERVDVMVGEDPAGDVNGTARITPAPVTVHLTRREWQLLTSSLQTFLRIDGIKRDWRPATLESMVNLHHRLSEVS